MFGSLATLCQRYLKAMLTQKRGEHSPDFDKVFNNRCVALACHTRNVTGIAINRHSTPRKSDIYQFSEGLNVPESN